MRLRHVLLITAAVGACASFLLAMDVFRRLKEAERTLFLNNLTPGPDSMLHFGMGHVFGLVALGLLFLAMLLMLVVSMKDARFVASIEAEPVVEKAVPAQVALEAASPPPAESATTESVEPLPESGIPQTASAPAEQAEPSARPAEQPESDDTNKTPP
jgi:hypothetical protein